MRKIILFVILMSCYFAAKADFSSPDFAYPQTVIEEAESHLKTAKGLDRLKAVMEVTVAKSSIDPDSLLAMPSFITGYAREEDNREVKGLMMLYKANILNRIYNRNRWKYDRVDAPATPVPADLAQWSGLQFKQQIAEAVDSAASLLKPYYKNPVRNYSDVIAFDDVAEQFYPYLRDFFFLQANKYTQDKKYISLAQELSAPGTAEWAIWNTVNVYDYADLKKMYDKNHTGLCGAYLLWKTVSQREGDRFADDISSLVKMIEDYIKSEPANVMTPALNTQLESLTRPAVRLDMPAYACAGKKLAIPCTYGNTSKIGVKVSYLSPQTSNNVDKSVFYKNFLKNTDKALLKATDTIFVSVDKPGRYYVEAVCDGVQNRQGNIVTFTPWMPVLISNNGKNMLAVTNFETGTPVEGILVEKQNSKGAFVNVGKTDSKGLLKIDVTAEKNTYRRSPLRLTGKAGSVYFGYDVAVSGSSYEQPAEILSGALFLDRPVYHPGDSIGWAVVVAAKHPREMQSNLCKDMKVDVILYDANYTAVDTMTVNTDEYGRAAGKFSIPEDLLTGRYTIVAKGKNFNVSASAMVSDFKAPVFELKNVSVERDGNDYVVKGEAIRYSGAYVAGAEVKVELSSTPYWGFRIYNWEENEASFTGITGDDGTFRIVIPADTLKNENYRCKLIVTSVAAETAEATTYFRAGKPYLLTGNSGDISVNIDTPVKLDIFAFGSDLKLAAVKAKWNLKNDAGAVVGQGDCDIDSLGTVIDFAAVPVGQYKLSIIPTDEAMFNALDAGLVTLYSVNRNLIPDNLKLIVPETSYIVSRKETKAEVNVGVSSDSYVYFVTNGNGGNVEVMLKRLNPGFNKVTLSIPESETTAAYNILTIKNGRVYQSKEVSIKRDIPTGKLTLVGESWRDKLVPGSAEQWHLKLSSDDGRLYGGAMVATLYNHALDALSTLSWPGSLQNLIGSGKRYNSLSFDYVNVGVMPIFVNTRLRRVVYFSVEEPSFMFNDNFFGSPVYIRGARRSYGGVVMEDMAVNMKMSAMATAGAADAVKEESAEAEEEASADNGSLQETEETFNFRDAETLQAFWMPDIKVDDNGIATLDFIVPNAIGAWSFRATAWTADCKAASTIATLTASKPVMVQPSVPRFMRRGDSLTVLATVINNTDSAAEISTVVEIFNPADGTVLSQTEVKSSITGKGQAIVPCKVEAPVNLSQIGYRVKSSDGSFTDGEQVLIPVLDATTTAIDSEVFYLTPADPEFTAKIRADVKGDGIVAVQYCQNPVWDVVRTLPGLYDAEPKTVSAAASSAYAALVAKGLLVKFPQIREVLDIWQANPADSAYTSKLQKNEELKLAMLSQTPFVGSANAMNDQLNRLAITFDENTINKVLATAVKKLVALQRADGGFAWGTWCNESSSWATRSVLLTIGRLERLGFAIGDSKLQNVIDKAFNYVDNHVDQNDYGYTRLYSLYPDRKPSTLKGTQAISKVKQQIVANWKKSTTATKASDALILNALGNKAVAAQIMNSVKQFAQNRGNKGVSFGSVMSMDAYATLLEAFARINPSDKDLIDGMRQWLVLQTQANDDLFAWDPTTLVSAILATGTDWCSISSDATANVMVDGAPLTLSKVESATGSFSQLLPASATARTLKVVRTGESPVAYGSLVTVATRPLAEVKARDCDGISITKRFLVEKDGKWVETSTFKLGDRVRVQLMIKTPRNMEYVTVNDDRPSSFEPVDQLPGWIYSGGNPAAYRENSDNRTRLFINYLPKGTYYYTYDMTAAYSGTVASGAATLQSQYAPELTARSAVATVVIDER